MFPPPISEHPAPAGHALPLYRVDLDPEDATTAARYSAGFANVSWYANEIGAIKGMAAMQAARQRQELQRSRANTKALGLDMKRLRNRA
jgi:hypothetical protein